MARAEEVGTNRLLAEGKQVFDRGAYGKKLNVETRQFGSRGENIQNTLLLPLASTPTHSDPQPTPFHHLPGLIGGFECLLLQLLLRKGSHRAIRTRPCTEALPPVHWHFLGDFYLRTPASIVHSGHC